LQAPPAPSGKSLMARAKSALRGPSLQARRGAAGDPVAAAADGCVRYIPGGSAGNCANNRCVPPPRPAAPGSDCAGSPGHHAACRVASGAGALAGTPANRNSAAPEPASAAERLRHTPRIAGVSSTRLPFISGGSSVHDAAVRRSLKPHTTQVSLPQARFRGSGLLSIGGSISASAKDSDRSSKSGLIEAARRQESPCGCLVDLLRLTRDKPATSMVWRPL